MQRPRIGKGGSMRLISRRVASAALHRSGVGYDAKLSPQMEEGEVIRKFSHFELKT